MPENLLAHINAPEELRRLSPGELPQLAAELREFIVAEVAKSEGHLGASLGVVELTIALHYLFDTPNDIVIWDVGHQAYVHKILTGRKNLFHTNRSFNGISGFPKRDESIYDAFGTGHSSTSVSAALGMALAAQLQDDTKRIHIAVIGDASIASGMAFEALNHAGVTTANLIVILNDNAIGIDASVGALKDYFNRVKSGIRERNNLIEAMQFNYKGPIDGHDFGALFTALTDLKASGGPRFLHVVTTKGKGLLLAEQNQVVYHAPGKFDSLTGKLYPKSDASGPKFQEVFGLTLLELARQNIDIIGITPAMPTGSSMKFLMDEFPERAFDVGIAEQHAVTFAAGLVAAGKTVFCHLYSTFMQRAYDQIIHDVALQNLSVIFCVDRAGIVGEDGPTHHGVFDIPALRCIPNLTLYAPRDEVSLRNILYTAQLESRGPMVIRYPRGNGHNKNWQQPFERIVWGKGTMLCKGERVAVISCGTMASVVSSALNALPNQNFTHADIGFIKPLDEDMLRLIFETHEQIITVEDGAMTGGFGSAVLEFSARYGYSVRVRILGIPDAFVPHGSPQKLYEWCGLDAKSLQLIFSEY